MKLLVVVGIPRPTDPLYPEALLPDNVAVWSSDQIPEVLGDEFQSVKCVYYEPGLGGRIESSLLRLFKARLQKVQGSAPLLHEIKRDFRDSPNLHFLMSRYYAEKPAFQPSGGRDVIGSRHPSGHAPYRTRW